jgi:hypothetical protein
MKILVAIADFGGRKTLPIVKSCFKDSVFTVVTFSTKDGEFLYPESIKEDLPFQHRKYFAENVDNYDYFIFTENDIFYPEKTLEFIIKNHNRYGDLNPIGLIREESGQLIDFAAIQNGPKIKKINDDLFESSNDHQASYFLNQNQLKKCIDSENYLINPCARNGYGKLETAASNVYFDCGLKKVYPIKDINSLIVTHLDLKWKLVQSEYTINNLYKDLNYEY